MSDGHIIPIVITTRAALVAVVNAGVGRADLRAAGVAGHQFRRKKFPARDGIRGSVVVADVWCGEGLAVGVFRGAVGQPTRLEGPPAVAAGT